MFAKKFVSQSMIDAVNQVLGETKEEVSPQVLLDEAAEKVPTPTGMRVYGTSYGNSAKARKDQTKAAVDTMKGPKDKELLKDDEIDETGFHKAAHGAKKAGQSHFEFQGKKYPVTAKSHAEAVEEESDCVTKPQAKDIAKKEVGKHEKGMHGKSGEVAKHEKKMHKEEMTFAERLKASLTENKTDGTIENFTDNNLGEMSDAQMKKREKIVMSMKKGEAGMKQRYGKNWKNVMYATATKQAMKEDSSDEWEGEEFKEEVELDEAATRKDFQMVADLIRANDSHDKRKELAGHHAAIFAQQNPRFDHHKFMKACGVSHEVYGEEVKKSDVPAFLRKMRGDKPLSMKDVKSGDKDSISHKDNLAKARNEEIEFVEEDIEVIQDKNVHKTTTDMLKGRVEGGKLNAFKNFKVNLVTSGEESIPNEVDKGEDTKEKQKITTNPGPVEIKFDDKLGNPTPQSHFSDKKKLNTEAVRGELKQIRQKEGKMHDQEVNDFAKDQKQSKLVHSKEEAELEEKVIAGTPGWEKMPKNVKDKSGAVHTPMSRAKDLARQSFKKIKNEMLGKISN